MWRLAWEPPEAASAGPRLAAACMQGGVRVLRYEATEAALIEEDCYRGHESIAYGVDWRRQSKKATIASCSFYDKELHLWEVETGLQSQ